MKTYLMIWFNSEGAEPQIVVQKLQGIGFKPMRGPYDHVYEWVEDVDLDKILQLGNTIHETLKGLKVLYKLETVAS
ncbi:MAG: hypothetical protein JSV20_08135 [Candidatus Bathyarchaeota archaeon]|nr:MAG: hypothetical protein JSV20_08135 [Candidatus Bathyarchaeota archaeon]